MSITIRDGMWTNPATWDVMPTPTTDAVIRHNVELCPSCVGSVRRLDILAGSPPMSGGLAILWGWERMQISQTSSSEISGGSLTFNGGRLDAYGSVVNWNKLSGTTGKLLFHVANDRLFTGNITGTDDDHSATDIGLWGMMGSVTEFNAPEVTPWFDAAPIPGATTKALPYGGVSFPAIQGGAAIIRAATQAQADAGPAGWLPGDTLLLCPIQGPATLTTLSSQIGGVVFFADKVFVADAQAKSGKWAYPKIVNLSRRMQIISADVKEGDFNHRAHCVWMGMGTHADLANVEFRNLGPRGKLGRYPIHFHHLGNMSDCPPGDECGATGCSVWSDVSDPGSRAIAIHDTSGLKITNNVAYNVRGHAYFMESGNETNNVVTGNLVWKCHGAEELKVTDEECDNGTGSPGTRCKDSHGYWLRTGNDINNNVAGDCDIGFVPLQNTTIPPAPMRLDLETYGCTRWGFWPMAPNITVDGIAAYNSWAGWVAMKPNGTKFDTSGLTVDDVFGCYNGRENSSHFMNHVYVNTCPGKTTRVTGKGVYVQADFPTVDKSRCAAFQSHYQPCDMIVEDCDVAGPFAAYVAYFSGVMRMTGTKLNVGALLQSPYPIYNIAPGFLDLDGVYYTGYTFRDIYGLPGTAVAEKGWKLATPPEPAGFIQPPKVTSTVWTICREGSVPPVPKAPAWVVSDHTIRPDLWKESLASGNRGYPWGIPPGDYRLSFWTQSSVNSLDAQGNVITKIVFTEQPGRVNLPVKVVSGQVADLTGI